MTEKELRTLRDGSKIRYKNTGRIYTITKAQMLRDSSNPNVIKFMEQFDVINPIKKTSRLPKWF